MYTYTIHTFSRHRPSHPTHKPTSLSRGDALVVERVIRLASTLGASSRAGVVAAAALAVQGLRAHGTGRGGGGSSGGGGGGGSKSCYAGRRGEGRGSRDDRGGCLRGGSGSGLRRGLGSSRRGGRDAGSAGGATVSDSCGSGSGDSRRGLRDGSGSASNQSRAGDGVGKTGGVDVDDDAGVRSRVQLGTQDTSRYFGAITGDLEVEALRIGLSAVCLACRVKRNGFVTEDVVARLNVGRDLDEPCVVILDQLVRAPETVLHRVVDKANLVDLEEFEGLLGDALAGAIAGRQVVDHGTLVRLRPSVPADADAVASLDLSMASCRSG